VGIAYYDRKVFYSLHRTALYFKDIAEFKPDALLAGDARDGDNRDGTGAAARFLLIRDIVSDGAGLLYVLDGAYVRVVQISSGVVSTLPPI
jgi:hypothetical protein